MFSVGLAGAGLVCVFVGQVFKQLAEKIQEVAVHKAKIFICVLEFSLAQQFLTSGILLSCFRILQLDRSRPLIGIPRS